VPRKKLYASACAVRLFCSRKQMLRADDSASAYSGGNREKNCRLFFEHISARSFRLAAACVQHKLSVAIRLLRPL
jgi:hypothetical protein